MRRAWLAPLLALGVAGAGDPAPTLDHPDAFERGFAVSLYVFDACGDAIAGRLFRRALEEKFAQCPFSPEARAAYARQTTAQQAKAKLAIQAMVDNDEGMPNRLEGMASTCHAQQADPDYQRFRERLERFSQGELPASAILAQPCDAADIAP